jgi:hypothetical protein
MPNTVQETMSKTLKQVTHVAGAYVIPVRRRRE